MDLLVKEKIKRMLIDETIHEFTQQGHSLTGAFEKAVECKVTEEADKIIFEIWGRHYGKYLNQGVRKENISFKMFPFVLNYVKLRMKLEESKAKGVAAAIINKWKQFGMPTANSYSFSKNGDRKNFIPRTLATVLSKDELISEAVEPYMNTVIERMCKNVNQINAD